MVLVRCSICGVKPPGRSGYKRNYVRSVEPLGHPNSALVCGVPSCSGAGLIWLEPSELDAYNQGQRVFDMATNTAKVRAQ
jgi:hypothetical protein